VTGQLSLANPEATEALGRSLAGALPKDIAGWIILLQGELGSGKSTLARAMLRAMGHPGAVPSPTYTLVEPYSLSGKSVYHIDLYRIADEEELDYLGWSDLEDGLRIIEWPERVPSLTNQADVLIELDYDGPGRSASLSAYSDRGREYLARLDQAKTSESY
jgi:tRNA threonylcarbamoyladenosine biosynthesis protein TsaE